LATTYSLQVPTLEDYDLKVKRLPVANHANFAVVPGTQTASLQTATYTYGAGAAADVFTAAVKRQYDPKNDVTNCSIRLSALVKTSVSETGEVSYDPIESLIAWNHSGKVLKDSSFAVQIVSVAFAVFAQELTGANGTPTTKITDQLDHSVVTKLFG
jgi:hypothetical protein